MDNAQRFRQALPYGLAAVAVLAVHLAFVVSTRRAPAFRYPLVDAAAYHRQALAILAPDRQPSDPVPFWQPPFYPYWLAAVYRLAGPRPPAAAAVNGLFSAVTAMAALAVARRLLPPRTAWTAAVLGACTGPHLFYAAQLLPTAAATAFTTLAALAWLRLSAGRRPARPGDGPGDRARPPRPRRRLPLPLLLLLLGGTTGLAALTAPLILALLPLLLAGALRAGGRRVPPARLRAAGTFLLGFALVIAPATLRNLLVSGEPVPLSTNGGINLYLANGPDWRTTAALRPGAAWNHLVAEPGRRGVTTQSGADRYFTRKTLAAARARPGAFLRALAAKAWLLPAAREAPRNLDIYDAAADSVWLRLLAPRCGPFALPFGLLAPLAVAGAVLTWRARTDTRALAAFVLCYAAGLVLFYPAARYRAPVLPVITLLAFTGILALRDAVRTATPRRRVAVAGLLLLAVAIVNAPRRFPTDGTDFRAELETALGAALQARGRPGAALAHYRLSLARRPDHADTLHYLGTALRALGRHDDARRAFEKALERYPHHAAARQDLAIDRFRNGRVEASVRLLREVLADQPGNRHAMRNLAVGLNALGHTGEAAAWMRRAAGTKVPDR